MTPDNFGIIGPMRHYPNVLLNVGYGPQGFQAISVSKIIEAYIEQNNADDIFTEELKN
jgi:hypothetical protein